MPLETLSGWPQVENPSILASLAILVGFPLLVFIIVVAISKIATAAHAGRGVTIQSSDPFWVGDDASGELTAVSANPGTEASDQAAVGDGAQAPTGEGALEGDDAGEHVGGAGARW